MISRCFVLTARQGTRFIGTRSVTPAILLLLFGILLYVVILKLTKKFCQLCWAVRRWSRQSGPVRRYDGLTGLQLHFFIFSQRSLVDVMFSVQSQCCVYATLVIEAVLSLPLNDVRTAVPFCFL